MKSFKYSIFYSFLQCKFTNEQEVPMNLKSNAIRGAVLAIFLFTSSLCEAQSFVKRSQEIQSTNLNDTFRYSIYFPPGYKQSEAGFPVIYLLHGFGGNENSWLDRCQIQSLADSLIKLGKIAESIIVMPDGQTSYYIDNYDGSYKYESFFVDEFIPHIDSRYQTDPVKSKRVIAGLSMGGFGSIVLAAKNPHLFEMSIGLGAAVRTPQIFNTLPQKRYEKYFGKVYGPGLDTNRINAHWLANSPYFIIDSTSAESMKSVYWYIDCGMQDFLFTANKAFHEHLMKFNIEHEYHMRPGKHNWEYWEASFVDALISWDKRSKMQDNKLAIE